MESPPALPAPPEATATLSPATEPLRAELELKFLAPDERTLAALARLRDVGPFRLQARRSRALLSYYLDTEDLRLAGRRVALRVRRDGTDWELTAKWEGKTRGALHERPELTQRLPGPPDFPLRLPAGPIRPLLVAALQDRPLLPILVTQIRRRLRDVVDPARGEPREPLAEVALDAVEIGFPRSAGAATRYEEIEVELKTGTRDDLERIGEHLRTRFQLLPSTTSKFERGLAALGLLRPSTPRIGRVGRDDDLEAAARKTMAAQLERLVGNDPGTRLGSDPESLHDMRVAVRRLRAAVRAFAGGFPPRLRREFARELRWLGRALGGVRDLDVQLALLDGHLAGPLAAEREGLDRLRASIGAERARHRDELLLVLDSPRYFRLLAGIERFTSGLYPFRADDAAVLVRAAARRSIRKSFRRLGKEGAALGDTPSPEDLHALRIRAKRLRYLLEFLRGITGAPGRHVVKALVELQDVLGAINDVQVAARVLARHADGAAEIVERLGIVHAERSAELEKQFRKAWARLAGEGTRRDVQAILDTLGD